MDQKTSPFSQRWNFVVIGAGMAGAFIAGRLQAEGKSVLIIDKARGSGGRVSSKRLKAGEIAFGVDLGCQFFEVSHSSFEDYLSSREDVVIESSKAIVRGRNSLLTRGALGSASTLFGARVLSASRNENLWTVELDVASENKTLEADHLILATPPIQAAEILGRDHRLYSSMSQSRHHAQWVSVFAFDKRVLDAQTVKTLGKIGSIQSDDIGLVSVESRKPDRNIDASLLVMTLHSSESWAARNLNVSASDVETVLLESLADVVDLDSVVLRNALEKAHVHRWLYARPNISNRLMGHFFDDASIKLSACGDYFSVESEYGVESAFLSANALLRTILTSIEGVLSNNESESLLTS